MMGRGEASYCAFDLVWLNGRDLRHKPLVERKRLLRELASAERPSSLAVHEPSGQRRNAFLRARV